MEAENKKQWLAAARDPAMVVLPIHEPPQWLVDAMAIAGAQREEYKEEGLQLVHVPSAESPAWDLYADWVSALGDPYPVVSAVLSPMAQMPEHPPRWWLLAQEANSIINHLALRPYKDFRGGSLADVLASLEPIKLPAFRVNVRDGIVAVTYLRQAISNPGPTFPEIHAQPSGMYICHLQYTWRGAMFTVPVFRA